MHSINEEIQRVQRLQDERLKNAFQNQVIPNNEMALIESFADVIARQAKYMSAKPTIRVIARYAEIELSNYSELHVQTFKECFERAKERYRR